MGESFPLVDIILLAMIAGFLILRLRSVLGRRTGHETPPEQMVRRTANDDQDNVVPLPTAGNGASETPEFDAVESAYKGTPLEAGLSDLRETDPGFSPEVFLGGAEKAFEMIVQAYAQGDEEALQPLLNAEVYANFSKAIQERTAAGEVMETELISVKTPSLESIELQDSRAMIAVRFVSEQVNVIKDSDGNVVDGDANMIETVTDIWTFSRDVSDRDPNWSLVATRSED